METFAILIAIFILICILIGTILLFVSFCGWFEEVDVGAGKPPIGAVVIAYKFAKGPYKNSGPLFFEAAKLAPDNKAIGIYYDDPNNVNVNESRYVVASVLAEDDTEPDKEMVKRFEEYGFVIFKLPKVDNAVRATFPYKSFVSIFIAVQKVYPHLCSFIEEKKLCAHPFLEIYDGQNIQFMVPLSKQQDFYVPEATSDQSSFDSTQDITPSDLSSSVIDNSQNEASLHSMHSQDDNCDEATYDAVALEKHGSDADSSSSSFEEVKICDEEKLD